MRRNVSLDEISDGRLYGLNDMVKADCHGCQGCHKCCTGMGNSVILDPFDAWRLCAGTGKSLQDLLAEGRVELNVVDGCILPNLRMSGEEEACGFLNAGGSAASMPTDRVCADFFRWGAITRTMISGTFCKQESVSAQTVLRSRSAGGSTRRSRRQIMILCAAGTGC